MSNLLALHCTTVVTSIRLTDDGFVRKSKAFPDPWRRSKQLSSNKEGSRGLLSNHDILIPFAPSSRIRSSLTLCISTFPLNSNHHLVLELERVHVVFKPIRIEKKSFQLESFDRKLIAGVLSVFRLESEERLFVNGVTGPAPNRLCLMVCPSVRHSFSYRPSRTLRNCLDELPVAFEPRVAVGSPRTEADPTKLVSK